MKRWTVAAIVVATLLYAAACSDEVYDLTSPPGFEWHILLRKSYSVVAFALVGYLLRRALVENGRERFVLVCIVSTAAYSGLIEVGQFILGSKEGLAWNAVDVACGALGGAVAIGDRLVSRLRKTS